MRAPREPAPRRLGVKGSLSSTSSIAAQAVKIYAVSGAVRNDRLVCCSCGQRNCAAQATTAIGVIERIPAATPSRNPNTMSIAGV